MNDIAFQIIHGKNKHAVTMPSNAVLSELLDKSEELTGVPKSSQKLICQAKTLTALDHATTLANCHLADGSKVMVLGRKIDPERDETYQKILSIEKSSLEIAEKLAKVGQEVGGIEDGHLPAEHHAKAVPGLVKRCKACAEEFMRLLEKLDGTHVDEGQRMAKSKRKSVATATNANLDRTEQLLQRLDALKKE